MGVLYKTQHQILIFGNFFIFGVFLYRSLQKEEAPKLKEGHRRKGTNDRLRESVDKQTDLNSTIDVLLTKLSSMNTL